MQHSTIYEDISFTLQEILISLDNIIDCPKNGKWMIKNGLVEVLIGILKTLSNSETIFHLTMVILNKLLHQGQNKNDEHHHHHHHHHKFEEIDSEKLLDTLEVLKEKENLSFLTSAELCLNKILLLRNENILFDCLLEENCYRFLREVLHIDEEAYLDPRFNKCYCTRCHAQRQIDDYDERGNPPRTYAVPTGWYRFALKTPPFAVGECAFENWHRAYHGTRPEYIPEILRHGCLLMPGDITSRGDVLKEIEENRHDENQPDNFNSKQIFVSPTIKYSDFYANGTKWNDSTVKVAFQVLIKPNSYRTGRETIGLENQIDPRFSNNEVEWFTNRRASVILYGLLVKID